MPEQDKPIDETRLSVDMLFRILPEESLQDVAKNLMKDIVNEAPPFFLASGEKLFQHGNVSILCGDYGISSNINTEIEVGKEAIDSAIGWLIDDEHIEALSGMGYNSKDDLINAVGLFILSNVNGESVLHNMAVNLFEEIGALAYHRGIGTIDVSEISGYINDIIHLQMENSKNIRDKMRWQGLSKHIESLLKSDEIKNVDKAIKIFNEFADETTQMYAVEDIDHSYDEGEINDVLNYFINPIEFLRTNPGVFINLEKYESEYGKLPRQYELPGFNLEEKKDTEQD